MPVEMESSFLKQLTSFAEKTQAYMFERVLNTHLQSYLFHSLLLKNVKISRTSTNLFKYFSANTLYVKHIPDSLQLLQKQTNLKIYSLTKNVFKLNIFAIYFRLKLFHHPYAFFCLDISHFIERKLDLLS